MRGSALLFALLLLAGGCMGGDSAAIDKSELKGLVLQPSDLRPALAPTVAPTVRTTRGRPMRSSS